MLDLFGSAIGNMESAEKWQRFLDINPEGKLLQESQDICEELMILLRVYSQQITVVKEFRRHLAMLKEDETRLEWLKAEKSRVKSQKKGTNDPNAVPESAIVEFAVIRKLDRLLSWHLDTSMSPFSDDGDAANVGGAAAGSSAIPTQEADVLLELIDSRRLELQELEETASRTCNQLERLLSLKQQQASILEAKAAKIRADESIKQGRSIIAFTVVTIFFLPLGFLAAFFGMNNSVSTNDNWMTLDDQVRYMFGISAIVVFIAISLAFSQTARTILSITVLPLTIVAEKLGLLSFWTAKVVDPLLALSKSGDRRRRIIARRERLPEKTFLMSENDSNKMGSYEEALRENAGEVTAGSAENRGLSASPTPLATRGGRGGRRQSLSELVSRFRSTRRSQAWDHVIDEV
ncbi:hypothetical protein MMYC01_201639 [Madurella mycetomatis]|uniref:Ankyrin repeat protein n=1 Tax=Madurella mycetomatis TaxID=100816 RepID=A0A175W2M1_9PEZI|nr:hypothetical protein MMYC01_206444 [Madurella mycetomatis]KXX82456.1 hypothetical protein MMYC01_201639 [Madurella mycetomatis]